MQDNTAKLIIKKLSLDVAVRISVLIQTFGLIWLIGLEIYGEFSLWFSTIVFLTSFLMGVTGSGLTVYFSENADRGILFVKKINKKIKSIVMGCGGINFLLIVISLINGPDLLLLTISMNVLFFYVSSGIYLAIFRGILKIQDIVRIEGYTQIVNTALILIMSYLIGLLGMLLVTLLIYAIKTLYYWKRMKTYLIIPDDSSIEVNLQSAFREILVKGSPYGMATIVNSATIWFGLFALTTLFSSSEAGIFKAAMNLYSVFTFFTNATTFVLLPGVLSRTNRDPYLNSKIYDVFVLSISMMGISTSFVIYFLDLPELLLGSFNGGMESIITAFFWFIFFSPIILGVVTIFSEIFKGVYPNRLTAISFEIFYGVTFFLSAVIFVSNFGSAGLALCFSITHFVWFLSVSPFWKKNRRKIPGTINPYRLRLFILSVFYIILEIMTFLFSKILSINERFLFSPLFIGIMAILFYFFLPKSIKNSMFESISNFRKTFQWKTY